MRLFVGIALPEPVRQTLATLLQGLASRIHPDLAEINWVKPANLHITLKFLGECPDVKINALTQALHDVSVPGGAFSLRLGGLGCFQEKGPLRTFWMGLAEGIDRVAALAGEVERVCEPAGFKKESRPFVPHLTLAKVKQARDARAVRALIRDYSAPDVSPFQVDSIILFRSILSPSGPTYQALQTIPTGHTRLRGADMIKEFKEFIMRGNVVDLAVGVIIGASFGKIVTSLVTDILMPPIGMLVGGIDFSDMALTLKAPMGVGKPVTINYGLFINNIIGFLIVAFCVFLVVKGVNILKHEPASANPTEKTCPECLMLVPLQARKCGHCTSTIA